jgi:hypothetical protein
MLNYTVPPLQFLIGSFDASQYLDSISLSVPMHEPGQALLWSGRFKVSNNLAARINGLTHADFSEVDTPGRWRPYQQLVRLNIRGYTSPAFRIDNYRYNQQDLSGEGTLTQIPTAVAGDRPGQEILTTVSGTVGDAIAKLLTAAFGGATVHPSYALHGDSGVLDVPLTSRNPWADALRLASLSWHWLGVNAGEAIVSISGVGGEAIFTRTLEQVELMPDLAAIFQPVHKVIVTGARQVPDTSQSQASIPTAPRPKFKTTTEYRPAGTVFPSLGSSTTPILFEEKTIVYQYWDDDSWSGYLPSNPLTDFLYDIQSQTQTGIEPYGTPPTDLNIPLQTIVMKRQPIGYVLPATGTSTTLTEAEVLVESNLRKLTLKPLGVIFPDLGTNASLAIEKREILTSELIPPGAQITPVSIGTNGQAQEYEPRPLLEALQPKATRPLKTEVLKGSRTTAPLGWTPILAKPLVVDFGFVPDQAHADNLAHQVAVREQRRRDQVLVDMPIPIEWLAAGWPLLSRCSIDGNIYLMDGCSLSISEREAKFGFTGALVAAGGVANYQISIDLDAEILFDASIVSAPAVDAIAPTIFEMIVGSGIEVSVIGDLIFECEIKSDTQIDPAMVYESIVSTRAMVVVAGNDNFANRIAISSQHITFFANNVGGATFEVGEPDHLGYGDGYRDTSLWWSWTPSVNGLTRIATAGSNFDTLLAVYAGTTFENLVEIVTNDDQVENFIFLSRTSLVSFNAIAGTAYQIVVAGYETEVGNIILSLDQD